MRLLILTILLTSLAMPAFAECGADHQASSSDSTTATSTPTSTTNSGG
jgi:predicted S18 family serine protease